MDIVRKAFFTESEPRRFVSMSPFGTVDLHRLDPAEHVEDFLDEVDELADAPKARVEEGEEHVLQSFDQIVQEHGFASFPFLSSTSVT